MCVIGTVRGSVKDSLIYALDSLCGNWRNWGCGIVVGGFLDHPEATEYNHLLILGTEYN